MTAPSLKDLLFSDLYLRLDQVAPALYRPLVLTSLGGRGSAFVPPEFGEALAELTAFLQTKMTADDGVCDYRGIRLRYSRQHIGDGEEWVCLRRIAANPPTLEQLHVQPHIAAHLRSLASRTGLILVAGATGVGKTSTAFALLNDFCTRFNNIALTIEDPIEYDMHGRVGESGYCFQIPVYSDDEWATVLKRSLRWAPRFILVGEIRTPAAARQVLRAATTGHLVLTTIHASSVEEALSSLTRMAEQEVGTMAVHDVASAMTAVLHQTLRPEGPFIRYLFTDENNQADPVRSMIRENRIGMITSHIDRLATRLSQGTGART
jgi:twitching motility protein PilT